MAIPQTIAKILTLPLSIAGRLIGAVTNRSTGAEAETARPVAVAPAPAASTPVPDPAAPEPQKPTAKKPAAPKSAAKKTAPAPKLTLPEVTPDPMPSVTDIDADAKAEDVDVTPADIAKAMGSQLPESGDTTS